MMRRLPSMGMRWKLKWSFMLRSDLIVVVGRAVLVCANDLVLVARLWR